MKKSTDIKIYFIGIQRITKIVTLTDLLQMKASMAVKARGFDFFSNVNPKSFYCYIDLRPILWNDYSLERNLSFLVTLLVIRWWADANNTKGLWTGMRKMRYSTKSNSEVSTPVWTISWQMQGMCGGVRGYHCNMNQWKMSVAKRADIEHFSNFISQ